jgi:hypothetical protein
MAFTINSIIVTNLSTGRVFSGSNIVGNVGEKLRVRIDFESTEVPNLQTDFANATLQYVLKSKASAPYISGSPVFIPTTFFENLHSAGVATITDNRVVSAPLNSFVGGKHGQIIASPTDFTISLPGGNVIRYEFDIFILPSLLPSDFAGGVYSIPTYFASTDCLTLYFQASIYEPGDGIVPSAFDDTRDLDLSGYFSIGNTGYFNEAYNVGSEFFNLSTWTPPAVIDPTLTQTYTAQITRTSLGAVAPALNFVANSQVKVMLVQLKDDGVWDVNKTYIENVEFHVLNGLANNTPVSTSKITNFTANAFSVDTINISFDLAANAITGGKQYAIWFNIGVENTDGFWITQNTQPHLLVGEQGSSLTGFDAQMFFSHWDIEPPTPIFNSLRSFRSDDGLVFCNFTNTNTVINSVQSFVFGFKR